MVVVVDVAHHLARVAVRLALPFEGLDLETAQGFELGYRLLRQGGVGARYSGVIGVVDRFVVEVRNGLQVAFIRLPSAIVVGLADPSLRLVELRPQSRDGITLAGNVRRQTSAVQRPDQTVGCRGV
jgi:hypothetical protein